MMLEHQFPSVCLSIGARCERTIVLAIHFVDLEFLSAGVGVCVLDRWDVDGCCSLFLRRLAAAAAAASLSVGRSRGLVFLDCLTNSRVLWRVSPLDRGVEISRNFASELEDELRYPPRS